MEKLEKLCRHEFGKTPEGKDIPLRRLTLAEKIEATEKAMAWHEEQLRATDRWSLTDLAFAEICLGEAQADLKDLKARQARLQSSQGGGSIDVDALKGANDLVEIAEGCGLKLKKRGGEFWALCPFHKEKTPSFSINREKGQFYCFGCQESGDIIDFVQKIQNLDFLGACRRLGWSG